MSDGILRPNIAVAIATAGRPAVLKETVSFLTSQTRSPDVLLICPAGPDDIGDIDDLQANCPIEIVWGGVGLPRQRNAILDICKSDIVIFIDDDFLMCSDYVQQVESILREDEDVVICTGFLLADGALGPGFNFEEGLEFIRTSVRPEFLERETYGGYGCNMAVRMSTVKAHDIRFDANLPLYAWLEDIDFSRQLAPFGRILKSSRLNGVHLGTKKSGRSSGVRLGYSQIVNPFYLAKKGTVSWKFALRLMTRNLFANVFRSFRSESWVDRPGRLRGNLRGMWHIVLGRASPANILHFS